MMTKKQFVFCLVIGTSIYQTSIVSSQTSSSTTQNNQNPLAILMTLFTVQQIAEQIAQTAPSPDAAGQTATIVETTARANANIPVNQFPTLNPSNRRGKAARNYQPAPQTYQRQSKTPKARRQ